MDKLPKDIIIKIIDIIIKEAWKDYCESYRFNLCNCCSRYFPVSDLKAVDNCDVYEVNLCTNCSIFGYVLETEEIKFPFYKTSDLYKISKREILQLFPELRTKVMFMYGSYVKYYGIEKEFLISSFSDVKK